MNTYAADNPVSPTLVFGHGAGAGQEHPWIKRVATSLAERGIHVVTFNFPYRDAGKNVPDKGPVLEDAFKAVWDEVAKTANGHMFAGGKSMGGRIASQAAARGLFTPPAAGLVFFGYPLHPPGKPAQRRDAHLPAVGAPMLFLHGTRDPFGAPDKMRDLTGGLAQATLDIIDGGDHSLARSKKLGDGVAEAIQIAAAWMLRQP